MKKTLSTHALLFVILISALAGCGGRVALDQLSPRDLFDYGQERYRKEKYLQAQEAFQALVYNFPGVSLVDSAQYYLALSYFGKKEYAVAQVEFNRLVLNYPSSEFFEHALFMRAVCLYEATPDHYGLDQSDLTRAISQLQDFLIDFPESELQDEAEAMLRKANDRLARKTYEAAIVYMNIRAFEAAQIYFREVIDNYTNSNYAAMAAYGVAKADFERKRFGEARTGFENFAAVYPDHEWVPKARKKAVESAFKHAEQQFDDGMLLEAQTGFQAFQQAYPNSDKVKKASDYLERISEIVDVKRDSTSQAGS